MLGSLGLHANDGLCGAGGGAVAQATYLPTSAQGGAVRVVEVMGDDLERARLAAAPHGTHAASSIDEMLAGEGLDIAVSYAKAPEPATPGKNQILTTHRSGTRLRALAR